jgi:hypothetical protein
MYVYVFGRGVRGGQSCREEQSGDNCTYDVTNIPEYLKVRVRFVKTYLCLRNS